MVLKKLFFLLFLMLSINLVSAQNGIPRSDFWSNVRFGGGLGFGLNNGGFNASVSPSAIYQFNDQLAAGTALNFNYAKFDNDKRVAYGASALTLYNPLPFLQLSAEYEQLRVNLSQQVGATTFENDFWAPGLFLGVGYTNQNFTIGIRYDVLYDENRSIYLDAWLPFVRVFF
ncbi:alpha-ketoglutarate decarboxylase [Maribacter sp. 2210JD10-5]|uniref:alpha-ketoglutarate decarboxylase n=1 Tax=Maribacter sp. 2210JD10-5 TaxID=3386272 RepID=UPI0039BC955D